EQVKAKPLALAVAPRNFGIALGWCGLLLLALAAAGAPLPRLCWALAAAAAAALLMRQWLQRRLGGYTGDGLGATEQFAEIAVLLAFTASR
ncbi:MAG TPA: adenosylcobinamide-GDP ribazoletransferase, partial [Roseateles sp.]